MKFGAFLLDGFRLSGYMPYLWITLGVLSVVVEAITRRRLAIWFLPAGIIAMASSFFTTPVWLQTLIFFAFMIVLQTKIFLI